MQNLKIWEEKIKEERKKTTFKNYIKNIVSRQPLIFNQNNKEISRFPETNRIKTINLKTFEETRDNLTKNGLDYNFLHNFFENISNLSKITPLPNMFHIGKNENCNYTDIVVNGKNSYLSYLLSGDVENILYTFVARKNTKDVINSVSVLKNSSYIYFSSGVIQSFNIFYSRYINDSNNIWFSSNLIGCQECLFCNDLENKSYCIKNQVLTKEKYFILKNKLLKEEKTKFLDWYSNVDKKGKNFGSKNINGNFIIDGEQIENGNFLLGGKKSKNIFFSGGDKESYNCYDLFLGGTGLIDIYGANGCGGNSNNIFCSISIGYSSNIFYSIHLDSCSFCIGCIGLKNKSFCILNKQYSKEEWYLLANEIFESMDNDGILGDFFPGSINPFYFNDTMAYLIDDSFTKTEVEKDGYMWRDEKIKVDIPKKAEIVNVGDLNKFQTFDSNGNWIINKEILKKVITDEKGNYYKIVALEYDFLMKYGLPLPNINRLDRIKMGFKFN